ncbi:MFS transporter [Corynebacterium sp. 13CS0277]|uniref:MFS transporter n=1 Tax=Corynebacterium sp. 13CS0277 TaxID=2071994 RepID=UPI000D038CEE|nr:MFS transporter [Corynebacterium sp. 13CS0277]PRQ12491.1 MFS transporter [Corynebacterium sp. 13CS0277]
MSTQPEPQTSTTDPDAAAAQARAESWPHRWWGVVVLTFALAVLAVDATVLNFAIPAITEDIAPTAPQMLWIVDIYAFALAALLVTMGNVGDRFGRRNVLLWGTLFFALASAAAGLAHTPQILIVARFVQGIAGACLMPSTLSLISAMFKDPAERARAVSIWIAVYSVGAAAGPLIGGFILNHFHWGAIFFINVPLCAVVIVGGLMVLPKSRADNPPALDVKGALLSVVVLLSLVYVIKLLPHEGPTRAVLLVAVVCVAAGVVLARHLRRATNPVIDVVLLRDPTFATIVLVNGMSMFLYLGVMFFLAQYLQVVSGYSVSQAAWLMFPGLALVVVSTLITGRIMTKVPIRLLLIIALIGAIVGCLLMGAGAWIESGLAIALAFVLLNCSLGMIDPVSNAFILQAAPPERAGSAAGMSETGYELGGAFGTAILGSIVMSVYARLLPSEPALPAAAKESIATAHELAHDAAQLAEIDLAFSTGVVVACGAAALIGAAVLAAVWRNIR